MDPLKPLSRSTLTSTSTPPESMFTKPDNIWEDTPSRLLDGESHPPDKSTGLLLTLGPANGE